VCAYNGVPAGVKYYNIAEGGLEGVSGHWAAIDAVDKAYKSMYSLSEARGELYLPNCREAVEVVAAWTLFARANEEGYRSFAFPGDKGVRERLALRAWNVHNGDLASFVRDRGVRGALFQ
jgi:hypothetical protein